MRVDARALGGRYIHIWLPRVPRGNEDPGGVCPVVQWHRDEQ